MSELPVVLCPTEVEASFVRRAARGRGRVIVTGVGPDRVRRALDSIAPGAPAVILCGLAGGLRPFRPGSVPRIRSVVNESGSSWTPNWSGPWPGHDETALVGVDAPVVTPSQKASLGAATGAGLVDCESHTVAAWAEQRNVSWGVVRGISDGPTDALPAEAPGWIDASGRVRPVRIARDLITRPALIPEVRRLHARTKTSMRDCAAQLDRMLDMIRASAPESDRWTSPRVGVVPVDASAKRIVVFGGTFDPPHRAHVDLSMKALRALNADALLIVPAARSPHKETGPTVPDEDRVAMLELAFRGKPGVAICTLELERANLRDSDPSFTIETLETLHDQLGPDVQMRLLIGADQAAAFHRWREVDKILAIAPPAVLLRPPIDSLDELDKRLRQHWTPKQMAFWKSWIVPAPVSKISATNVRQSTQRSQGDLPSAVARYIEMRGLYKGPPERP